MKSTSSAWLAIVGVLFFGTPALAAETPSSAKLEKKMKKYSKPSDTELKKKLTPLQYDVSRNEGTEPAFRNEYWDNKKPGIYVDLASGEPLFSSVDKFDSGTGWPSFTKPLEPEYIVTHEDGKLFMKRVEVRSKFGQSHLGHVFDDGPAPTGLRYCMNSASLRFVPVERMAAEGYSDYLPLFTSSTDTAVLAGGCFWGVEELIRKLPGVVKTVVGYTGGFVANPTYELVYKGDSGHAEAIRVEFDLTKITYEAILAYFFRLHDPTTKNRQGNDVGSQYRSAIFYQNDEQKKVAEKVKDRVNKSEKWKAPVVTEIVAGTQFYPAEEEHQDYLQKHPNGYTCHFLRN